MTRLLFFGGAFCGEAFGAAACAEAVVDEAVAFQAPRPDAGNAPSVNVPESPEPEPASTAIDASVDAAPPIDAAVDATIDAGTVPVPVTPPTLDGTIASGEYGAHTNGQNQEQASDPSSAHWYMTWTETHLHVGVTAANIAEGVVLYVDHSPVSPSNGGTNADGSLVGFAYDNTQPGALPFRADFVAYVKDGYEEHRRTNGSNGWSAATTGAITVKAIGTVREIAIPWSAVRVGGRPPSFAWLGYATSAGGYVYGDMPPGNPNAFVGTNASFKFFYSVPNATPGTGAKPFAMKLGI